MNTRMNLLMNAGATAGIYRLRLTRAAEDVAAAQRLRFNVFNLELREGLASSEATGHDADAFDNVCDHLVVEAESGADAGSIVGTYRLQTGRRAAETGLGYYSAQEFSFAPLEPARGELVELGRACVAAEHRNQTVLALLWRGVANYATTHGARYLVGCSSLTSRDASEGWAAWEALRERHWVEPRWRTEPRPGWECVPTIRTNAGDGVDHALVKPVRIPRLMASYLALGAKVAGPPALDREFGTVDFLTWLDLATAPERVLRKYLS